MVAFRKYFIALAGLATFAGLASAQAPTPMSCNVTSSATTGRAESHTELLGDLVITCTGGTALVTAGSGSAGSTAAPAMDVTISLPQNVTSRILGTNQGSASSPLYPSEALLLIDDPQSFAGAPVPGFGIGAAPSICGDYVNGCPAYPNEVGNFEVMSNLPNETIGSPSVTGKNVYQGLVNGKTIKFVGVPVLPPGSTASRIFRITNVRMDAAAAGSGSIVPTVAVVAHTTNVPTAFPTLGTIPSVATVQTSLTTSASPILVSNCIANVKTFAGTVSFAEAFATAFKTRIVPAGNTAGAAQGSGVLGTPGSNSSNTESGYILPALASASATAGLADFGTRLKAVFSNIPSGVHVFVSYSNVTGANTTTGNAGTIVNGLVVTGGTATNSLAVAISGNETAADPTAVTTPPTATSTAGSITVVELTPATTGAVAGTNYTAIWEVSNSNQTSSETLVFDVFVSSPAQQTPAQPQVTLNYAPTSGLTPTSTTPEPIPDFASSGTGTTAFSLSQCQTTLLFPFITSGGGFDTGLAISNTSADTYGTTAQSGTCQYTLYGTPTPVPTVPATASVTAGTTSTLLLSSVAPGFTGYAIAVCNFQYAHGFAFVADWTSPIQSSAMGYLALIMPSTTTRGLSQGGATNAEALGQ